MKKNLSLVILILFSAVYSEALIGQLKNPHNLPYTWNTDTTKKSVRLSELSLATGKDAIRTLDFPAFITKDNPLNTYYEFEPVISVNFGGEARAYPLSILTLFELANDSIGGEQVMVTFCPMCNAALVLDRVVKKGGVEKVLKFGVSGILMHNDMVMYDTETETWWQQMLGMAIVGEYSGVELPMMAALLISVKDFFDRFPDGKILSPDGIDPKQGKDGHRPFTHLEHGKKLKPQYYLPEKVDPRLPPLEHVVDVHVEGHNIIYPFHEIAKAQVINGTETTPSFVIFYHGETVSVMDKDDLSKSKKVGTATVFISELGGVKYTFTKAGNYFKDDQTGSTWDITGYCREGTLKGKQLWILPHSNHFAFAYLAFFPDVEIFGQ